MQPFVSAHFFPWPPHVLPPQSTSVSVPFFCPSVHVAAWHTLPAQTLFAQSPPMEHALPSAQFPPHVAPQSTSVSLPFFIVSLHVGTWHLPPVHTPLVQSAAPLQAFPSAHFFPCPSQVLPPQSVSVSVPFFTPSLHVAATHVVPLHTPLAQSVPTVHPPPVPQRAHVDVPPQSVPDSSPFFTPSLQLGAWHAFITQTPLAQSLPPVHA
jgi:hypothetical protein